MKTRLKILIAIIMIVVAIGIYMLLPPTMKVILCEDRILNPDDCGPYIEEKYLKLPIVQHFKETYPDPPGLGFSFDRFKVVGVTASSILADKIFVFLKIDLNDMTVTYICQNHNLGDDYLIVELVNPTIEAINNNDCRVLNQLEDLN